MRLETYQSFDQNNKSTRIKDRNTKKAERQKDKKTNRQKYKKKNTKLKRKSDIVMSGQFRNAMFYDQDGVTCVGSAERAWGDEVFPFDEVNFTHNTEFLWIILTLSSVSTESTT